MVTWRAPLPRRDSGSWCRASPTLAPRADPNDPRRAVRGLRPGGPRTILDDLARFVEPLSTPTIIFVSHHIEELPSFIGRGLILKEGRDRERATEETHPVG